MRIPVFASLLGGALLLVSMGCEKTLSPEAQAAQDAAKAQADKVALLEKELAEIKSGKATKGGDADAAEISKSHQRAIERQLADAKKKAEAKQKAAQELAAAPAPKEAPKLVTVDVPAETPLSVTLAQELATDKVQAGDPWNGTLATSVSVGGKVVWPAGTPVKGVVSQSVPAGRLASGNSGLGIKLTEVGTADVDTGVYLVTGGKRGERNTKFIAGGAALGALVGILSDKKNQGDHALGGAAIGAAAGTALAAGTADTIIRIKTDAPIEFKLSAPEKVVIK